MSFAIRAATSVALCLVTTVSTAASEDLDDVVVTANRVEQRTKDVIGSVTVIDREEIERRQAQSVQDLLRGEAGIDIANSGGLGQLSSLFMRGANSTQTLFLVDGVRVGSATAGATRIEFLPVDQIERIEIVRGPRSSLYGSDAIGGVIQIFTRKPNGVNASLGVASHHGNEGSAGFGIEENGIRFSVSGSHLESDGINACNNSIGCYTTEPDRDGFRSNSGNVRLGFDLGSKISVELGSMFTKGYSEYDGSYYNQSRFSQTTPNARIIIKPATLVDITAAAGLSTDNNDDFLNGVYVDTFNTRKRNASLQTDWHLAATQTLTLGGDYLQDVVDSDTPYDLISRKNTAGFAQYLGTWSWHTFSVSLRQDDNEQFGAHTTGSAGWKIFLLDRALALNVGTGTAFHAPTFNDLYYPGFSNSELRPERSRSYEVGLSGVHAWLSWSAQAYQTQVKDLIALDGSYLPSNIGEARIRGLELNARTQWQQLNAAVNYTFLDPRSRADDANYGHVLPRRARRSGRLELGYDLGAVDFNATLNVVGHRFDNLANTSHMGGYSTVDLGVRWTISDQWSLQGKLANATDHEYETVRYYNQEGRNWQLRASFRQ